MVKMVYRVNVEGNKGKGGSQGRRKDDMKGLLTRRGLSKKEGALLAKNKEAWDGWFTDLS